MDYSHIISLCDKEEIELLRNAPLSGLSTMRIGGSCDVLVRPHTGQQLKNIMAVCQKDGLTPFILGKGSNVLFGDYHGVIVHTAQLSDIEVSGNIITAGCGASLAAVCRTAFENALGGVENLFGIPASVGGALYMNAGAYGSEMRDVVRSARVLNETGEIVEISADSMELSYRHSVFQKKNCCILSVTMQLFQKNQSDIKAQMEEIMQRRLDKQPLEYPSCGSTFKRPVNGFAAAMIEECGLKGYSIGGAEVSTKHSGFVINKGGATLDDVKKLVSHIKRTVREHNGVELECEMLIIEN